MDLLIMSLVAFILVYIIYYFLIIKRPKQLKKYRTSKEVLYLETKYDINIDRIPAKTLASDLALANSIIITLTFALSELVDNVWLKLLLIFVLLLVLIVIVYHFIGKVYVHKYGRKVNSNKKRK